MKKLQKRIYEYSNARGWHKLAPGDLAKAIMIEGAELLEHFQWDNPTLYEVKKDKEKIKKLASELADVFIYAIELGTELGLDLDKVIEEKLKHAEKKYPAGLMKKITRRDGAGRGAEYWEIKKKYRREN